MGKEKQEEAAATDQERIKALELKVADLQQAMVPISRIFEQITGGLEKQMAMTGMLAESMRKFAARVQQLEVERMKKR